MVLSVATDVEHSFREHIRLLTYPNFGAKAAITETQIILGNAM